MITNHPKSSMTSLIHEAVQFARIFAEEYANSNAESIFPIQTSREEWEKDWEFAWKSALNYALKGES